MAWRADDGGVRPIRPHGAGHASVASAKGVIPMATAHLTHPEHAHQHGVGCGHVAVPHGDHVDYAHEGHLHRMHEGHADECETQGHAAHDDAHEHEHGEGCGHVAIPHGDHVDYVHDGHRHAPHDGHWDEH